MLSNEGLNGMFVELPALKFNARLGFNENEGWIAGEPLRKSNGFDIKLNSNDCVLAGGSITLFVDMGCSILFVESICLKNSFISKFQRFLCFTKNLNKKSEPFLYEDYIAI